MLTNMLNNLTNAISSRRHVYVWVGWAKGVWGASERGGWQKSK